MNPIPPRPAYPPAYDPADENVSAVARPQRAVRLPSTNAEDLDLLRRITAHDEEALGALYDRWARLVHSMVLQMLGDADDAEDVVEETFWQVWRQAERYSPTRGQVSTWLITIGRSRALDRMRATRRLRQDALPPADTDVQLSVATVDPEGSAIAAEQRALVGAALRELPAEQRAVLELAYYGGLSQSEIAAQTGQPLGTVKTRMRLAAQKLRERLSMLREGTP